jgi:hypothetical protein
VEIPIWFCKSFSSCNKYREFLCDIFFNLYRAINIRFFYDLLISLLPSPKS